MRMKITAKFEAGGGGGVFLSPSFCGGSTTSHVAVGRSFNGLRVAGAVFGGHTAFRISTVAFNHGRVESRRMAVPPHPRRLIRGGIKYVPWSRTGNPPSIRLRFALIPTVVVGGFVVAGVLLITALVVGSMWVNLSGGGAVRRGSLIFGGRRRLVAVAVDRAILVTKRGEKVKPMRGRVALRGTGNCEFLGLVERGGRRVRRTVRER